jgi:sugar transferase (PEP-CTERM system associated)
MKALAVNLTRRSFTLVAFETLLIVAAVVAATWVRIGDNAWTFLILDNGLGKAALIAVVCQVCLYYCDVYELPAVSDKADLFIGVIKALAAASFLLAAVYFWFPSLIIGRGVFVIASFFVPLMVASWRLVFEWGTKQVSPSERLLLVGTGPGAVSLARELYSRRQELGVEIVGFVDPDPARVGAPVINPGVIGTVDDIPTIIRDRSVDRVVVSLADARGLLPMDRLLDMKMGGVSFDHLASVYEELTGKIAVENLRPSWLIFSSGFRRGRTLPAVKRAFDMGASTIGLLIAWPIMLLTALAVKLTSPGPVVYKQQRVGWHGHIFTVYKFRTMRQDAEANTGAVWAHKDDPRITRVGKFLRRSRLDELLQLWNVLKGDMSLVGPRPERPEFVTRLTSEIPYYGQRHTVRPGLTGWAQVRYTYGSTVEDAIEKLQYDLYYIKNLSLALDLFIMFSTVKTVLLRRGA